MNNLTQTQQQAKQAFLNRQQDEMLALYKKANTSERNAIIKQIDSFLSVVTQEQKLFWLRFRYKLERLNEESILFPLGNVHLTVGAKEALNESNQHPNEFLARHRWATMATFAKMTKGKMSFRLKKAFGFYRLTGLLKM